MKKRILLVIILTLLALPVLQSQFKLIDEKPLLGSFQKITSHFDDSLSVKSWLSGSLQSEADKQSEADLGFRNSLIRLHNQVDYSFFRKVNAEGVVSGSNNELFEEDYIRAYQGEFFVGEKVWIDKARKLKQIQDTLAKLNKTLVVIFEPGKGTVYHDRFPGSYAEKKKSTSNIEVFQSELIKNNVNILDLNNYFVQLRDKDPYRIFPKGGTHWSYYGAARAADTTLRFLKNITKHQIPLMTIATIIKHDEPRHPDADIWQAMNLIQAEPNDDLVYPVIRFESNVEPDLDVLVVGDSFYFNWQSDSIMYKAFKNCDFWYYNKHNWSRDGAEVAMVSDLNWKEEVVKRDLIIIMITERFHHNFAWNFDEQLYQFFYPVELDPVETYANSVRIYNDHFMRMVADAKVKKISLEERITLEAKYLHYLDITKNPNNFTSKEDHITFLMMGIRNTPEWLAKVKAKAIERKIPLDEMIRLDAEWIYNEKYGNKLKPS
ncbi:MAG: hypothetical protein HOO86_03265 [Bacteroidales bacterium]|nr:hypothetical protein [Bacteroidales bacterium]